MQPDRVILLLAGVAVSLLALLYSTRGPFASVSGTPDVYVEATAVDRGDAGQEPAAESVAVAALMRTGLPFPLASSLPPALFTIAIAITLAVSRLPLPLSIGLLCGAFTATFVWSGDALNHPGLAGAQASLAALCAFAAARSREWSPWLYGAAAALTALACALTPWALGVALAPPIYLVVAWRESGSARTAALAGTAAIAVATIVVALRLFGGAVALERTVDDWRSTLGSITERDPDLRAETYEEFAGRTTEDLRYRPPAALLRPAFAIGWPVWIWPFAVLVAYRPSRLLAFASLPLLVFLMLMTATDNLGEFAYVPEVAFYLTAAATVLALTLTGLASRLDRLHPANARAAALALIGVFFLQAIPRAMGRDWNFDVGPALRFRERAVARQIVGDAPVTLIDSTAWFISGGRQITEMSAGDAAGKLQEGPGALLGADGALVLTDRDLDRSEAGPLAAYWFESRRFALAGIVVTGDDQRRPTSIALTLRPGSGAGPRLFLVTPDTVLRFDPGGAGTAELIVATCPIWTVKDRPSTRLLDARVPFFGSDGERQLLTVGISEQPNVPPADSGCVVRERVPGSIITVPPPELQAADAAGRVEFR